MRSILWTSIIAALLMTIGLIGSELVMRLVLLGSGLMILLISVLLGLGVICIGVFKKIDDDVDDEELGL